MREFNIDYRRFIYWRLVSFILCVLAMMGLFIGYLWIIYQGYIYLSLLRGFCRLFIRILLGFVIIGVVVVGIVIIVIIGISVISIRFIIVIVIIIAVVIIF